MCAHFSRSFVCLFVSIPPAALYLFLAVPFLYTFASTPYSAVSWGFFQFGKFIVLNLSIFLRFRCIIYELSHRHFCIMFFFLFMCAYSGLEFVSLCVMRLWWWYIENRKLQHYCASRPATNAAVTACVCACIIHIAYVLCSTMYGAASASLHRGVHHITASIYTRQCHIEFCAI